MLDVFGTEMCHGMKTRKHLSAKTFFRLGTTIFGVLPLAFPSPSSSNLLQVDIIDSSYVNGRIVGSMPGEIICHGVSGLVVAIDENTCSKSTGYSDNEWCENEIKRGHAIERRVYERLGHYPRIYKYIRFKDRTVIM